MKKMDVWIICLVLLLAALFWLVPRAGFFFENGKEVLRITVDGKEYGSYFLDEEQVIQIGNTNVCRIVNGTVKMTEASCPDHLCIKQRKISKTGGSIVCLPNRVVLEIAKPGNDGLDAVAQ